MAVAVGIDLGTAYSSIAIFRNGNVEVIANEQDNRTTPSYVAFTDVQRLIGSEAKSQAAMNSKNTIFDAKRLIGRKIDDPILKNDMKYWPFKVINHNGALKIQVQHKNETKLLTVEEISSMILTKMKDMAEAYVGKSVFDAVITVPDYFNNSQRQATKDAGTIAGLNVLRVISESTAAALAYGFDKRITNEKDVFIFDLGGGTFNVSIVSTDHGVFEVKSTAGNIHLGGEDFDVRLVDHFVREFKQQHGKDISENKRIIRRLRTACECAKLDLSSLSQASIEIESLYEDINFYSTITRVRFEDMNFDLFHSTLETVEKALRDARMDKNSIDDIILIGGSTRIPKLQQMLRDFFNGKELNRSINPDEAVACGAAIQAAILVRDESKIVPDLLLLELAPFSLGIETVGGAMTPIIRRNSSIPIRATQTVRIHTDERKQIVSVQKSTKCFPKFRKQKIHKESSFTRHFSGISIKVFEGDGAMTKDNNLLDCFELNGISSVVSGEKQIEVTFNIDVNGILTVSAVDRDSENRKEITVKNNRECLSQNEIERMIADAETYRREDKIRHDRIEAKNKIESYCFEINTVINNKVSTHNITVFDYKKITNSIEEILAWLQTDPLPDQEHCESRLLELQQQYLPIMVRFNRNM
ncbi:unnamed protein product [Rotaria socialis]|uniref:Uncharacterized protein n=2 Tax=Rotaria socialis TaxID=392032 RepID=A0A818I4S6_9BILA|nr:unnamed protein product [Rotaria socialis]CAF4865284.1 unnamed protein product [Rotaria socialis]